MENTRCGGTISQGNVYHIVAAKRHHYRTDHQCRGQVVQHRNHHRAALHPVARFAIGRADLNADITIGEPARAVAKSATDVSAIVDLAGTRDGRAHRAFPNTNLIVSKTIVPQLRGEIAVGTTVLVTAAMALPAGDLAEAALGQMPHTPDLQALEALFAREGVDVSAILVPERF